jgi:hypothetical protein
MLASLMRQFLTFSGALLAALLLQWMMVPTAVRAAEQAELRAAVETATSRYEAAMATLDKGARDQTAAEVRRFRESWQALILKFGSGAGNEEYAPLFMQIDSRIVGALVVIDVGARDAARKALAPIGDTLADLNKQLAKRK